MGTETGVKLDQNKLRMSLIPAEAIEGLAEVLTFGASKYTKDGWKDVPNAEERYMDALLRHIVAFQKGEIHDPESGIHHLKHVLCNASFLVYFQEQNKGISGIAK